MSDHVHFTLTAVVWGLFITLFLRPVTRTSWSDARTRSGWLQLFLAALVFTLQGVTIEHRLDSLLAGLPVALYLKYFGMLLWFILYYHMVKSIFPDRQMYTLFDRWFLFAWLTGIVSLLPFLQAVAAPEMRELVIGWRDFMLLGPTLVVFIPAARTFWRQEQIKGMKSKQLAVMICFMLYSLVAVGNVLNAALTLLHVERTQQIAGLLGPILVFGLGAFVLILLPYAWVMRVFYPVRLYRYWKLRRLESYVLQQVGGQSEHLTPAELMRLWQADALELAIYRSIINVIDYGALLKQHPNEADLYQRIRAIALSQQPYSEIVHQLTEVK